MHFPTRSLSICIVAASCLCLSGCFKFYGYRDVTVSVHDAETGRPIPNAKIDLHYRYMMVLNAPKPTSGITGADGSTMIRAANFEMQDWEISAEGYLGHLPVLDYDIDKNENLDFQLYREPAPKVTVIVPNGFHGPLMIERHLVSEKVQGEPGCRQFTFRAPSNGHLLIDAALLLMRADPSDITAAFENGKAIPNSRSGVGSYQVALREVTSSRFRDLFVIGTEEDFENIKSIVYTYKNGDRHSYSLNEAAFNSLFDAATTKPTKP